MSLEDTPQFCKISSEELQAAASKFLDGTELCSIMTRMSVDTDPDGNVQPHVIGNLRSILQAVIQKTPDPGVRLKWEAMHKFLETFEVAN